MPTGDEDDEDDEDDEEVDEGEDDDEEDEDDVDGAGAANDSSEEEEEEDAADQRVAGTAPATAGRASLVGGAKTAASEQRAARKREANWLSANFITVTKSANGASIYKSELLPDKVIFGRDKLEEFVNGKRYRRLLHEMKKGMRTHAENEKLKAKASKRRERQQERRAAHKKEKVQRLRAVPDAADTAEIDRRKAKFQEKKARRLARKAESEGENA